VPLIGPWSGIACAPALGLRQAGYEQDIFPLDRLREWTFELKAYDIWKFLSAAEKAWMVPSYAKTNRAEGVVKPGYELWRKTIMNDSLFP